MLSIRKSHWLVAFSVLWVAIGFRPALAQELKEPTHDASSSPGKRTYASTCAVCHGLDGRGGERAPNIATIERVQRFSNQKLSSIIADGISGTGMPAFRALTPVQIRSLVSYVRALQGKGETGKLPGNPQNGKAIFFGKADCSSCHAISGEGGFLGPDLTVYGSTKSGKAMFDDITNADRIVPNGYRMAAVTATDGTHVEGIVRNEDNFSVQLQAKDSSYHLLQKSNLQKVEYQKSPLMPTDYARRLSRAEIDDLISYLMSVGRASGSDHSGDTRNDKE